MASKPLRFHPEAEREYLTSLSWYRDRSRIAATNFETAFERAVERIRAAPQRWPLYFRDFRKYVLRQFPFSVIYQGITAARRCKPTTRTSDLVTETPISVL
jgi:hypothetical protein